MGFLDLIFSHGFLANSFFIVFCWKYFLPLFCSSVVYEVLTISQSIISLVFFRLLQL